MTKATQITKTQGARLKTARIAAGYRSARAAAKENEWPESTVRAHENGTRTIGQDDAERYARIYKWKGADITAKEILFGENGNGSFQTPASSAIPSRKELLLGIARELSRSSLVVDEGAIEKAILGAHDLLVAAGRMNPARLAAVVIGVLKGASYDQALRSSEERDPPGPGQPNPKP